MSAGGSGISVVQFTMEKREDAENLSHKLFKENLIADVQIMDNNYNRLYMKYKKENEEDNQISAKFITADDRVATLMKFIKEHNPN